MENALAMRRCVFAACTRPNAVDGGGGAFATALQLLSHCVQLVLAWPLADSSSETSCAKLKFVDA